uniref:MFS domain-containing protein n=1 Tax=Heterorhabditis bacteriophora TaxID=37862 RepID=A0A1I7WPD9_HETBA
MFFHICNTVALWSLLLSSTYFLKNSNVSSELAAWSSTGMTLAYVLGTLTGSMMIERLGRRTLLLSFTLGNNVILVFYVLFAELHPLLDFLKYFCLIALLGYGFTYGVSRKQRIQQS